MRVAMLVVAAWLWAPAVLASSDDTGTEDKAPEKVLIEIYRIAPGKHEAFLRDIAAFDKANELAGLPPRQLLCAQRRRGLGFPADPAGAHAGRQVRGVGKRLEGAGTAVGNAVFHEIQGKYTRT